VKGGCRSRKPGLRGPRVGAAPGGLPQLAHLDVVGTDVDALARRRFSADCHEVGSAADQVPRDLGSAGEVDAHRRPLLGQAGEGCLEGEFEVREAASGRGALLPDRDDAFVRDEQRPPTALVENAEVAADTYQDAGEPAGPNSQADLGEGFGEVDEKPGPGCFSRGLVPQSPFPRPHTRGLGGSLRRRPTPESRRESVAVVVPLHFKQS